MENWIFPYDVILVHIFIKAKGSGALFGMEITAFLGMATKYAEGLLEVRYRVINKYFE